jgi:hypothetical protein
MVEILHKGDVYVILLSSYGFRDNRHREGHMWKNMNSYIIKSYVLIQNPIPVSDWQLRLSLNSFSPTTTTSA